MRQSGIDLSSECSLAERNCIAEAIKTLSIGGNFLEVGTAAGGTLKEIINTSDEAKLSTNFFVLDPLNYFPNQLTKIHQNLSKSKIDPSRVEFWEGTTDNYLPVATAKKLEFSFIFIDGDHKAFPVMNDLRWMDLLSPGGIACFHDYNIKFPGVIWSLDRFLARNDQFRILFRVDSLIVVRREGENIISVNKIDLFLSKFMQIYLRLRRSVKKRLGKI